MKGRSPINRVACSSLRKPLYNPLCGDVWQLDDGQAFVVDYQDGLTTGMTFLDGSRRGCGYTEHFAAWVKRQKGKLISSFEHMPLPWNCDDRGWTKDRNEKVPTSDQSMSFLKLVLGAEEKVCAGTREDDRRAAMKLYDDARDKLAPRFLGKDEKEIKKDEVRESG